MTQRRGIGAALTQGLGGINHPRISIDGNEFTLLDAGGNGFPWPEKHMRVIFIDGNANVSKRMFDPSKPYNPAQPEAPVCWSDNGIGPSRSARYKLSKTCASCQYNEWDSDVSKVTGKGIKMCRDFKKTAVLVVDPNGNVSDLAYEFDIPPNSLKALTIYSNRIQAFTKADGQPADVSDVLTWVWFVSQGTLGFAEAGWVEGAQQQAVEYHWNNHGEHLDRIVGRTDVAARPEDFTPVIGTAPAPQVEFQPQPAPLAAPGAPAPAAPFPGQGVAPPNPTPMPAQNQPPQQRGMRGGARPGAGRRKGPPPGQAAPAAAPGFSAGPPAQGNLALPPQQEIIPPGTSGPSPQFGGAPPMVAPNPSAPSFGPAPGSPSFGAPTGGPTPAAPPLAQGNDPGPMPGFLNRMAPPAGGPNFGGSAPASGPPAAPNGSRGGFQTPGAPDADVNNALNAAFAMGAPRGQ